MLGCLHKQQLTVKNEGSVAVTLTLSTAVPYSIVSALPTLSPGQSGQVTVRFDPSESGTFTGNVQVGIQNGQGSLTSGPLNGVAHKIEIDPAELSFGLVFLGSSRTRKLTVRNQGVTTVALTVNVSGPYSLESPNSFTFAFTRRGAQGVAAVIMELQGAYANSPIPIIVSWVNNQGSVNYTCIGSPGACAQAINSGDATRIACNQQGFAANCRATFLNANDVGNNKFDWIYQPPSVITGYMAPWKAGYVPECGDRPAWDKFLCY